MKIADLPTRFNIPFGNNAGAGYIRSVPQASQVGIIDGAASLTTGFPPLNFLPVGAGGVPPFGQDMNGILRQITQWSRWQAAGAPITYDSAFSTAVGGYPKGALLSSTASIGVWLNSVDDNISNPDASGAGWTALATATAIQNSQYIYAVAGGTVNALTVTLTPAPTSYVAGLSLIARTSGANTGSMSINVNGLGAKPIVDASGSPFPAGQVASGTLLPLFYNGTSFVAYATPSTLSFATVVGVQNSQYVYSTAGGTANALTVTLNPAPSSYVEGLSFIVRTVAANTGAMTVNVNALGSRPILDQFGAAISANQVANGTFLPLIYDGANFIAYAAGSRQLGVNQSWQSLTGSRVIGTIYQNTTGGPIQIAVQTSGNSSLSVSTNNVSWVTISSVGESDTQQAIIPSGNYYRVIGGSLTGWSELR